MIIVCPSCETRYSLAGAEIGPEGRKVRCSRCGHTWHERPDEASDEVPADNEEPETGTSDEEASAADMPAPQEAADRPPVIPPRAAPRARPIPPPGAAPSRAVVAWAGLVAAILAILGAGVLFRDSIASVWPPSARIFALIGLEVGSVGLDIANVVIRRDFDDGTPIVAVEGEIVNVSDHVRKVPRGRVGLLDERGRELSFWTFAPPRPELEAGERVAFATSFPNPPEEARQSIVTLLPVN